ncbi:MAG TPA: glycoside hydrolase family 32 protein [Anaerolineaceae bacterium]|jgi:beta-fructofuranosidase|nr:glycoside hydrolase family 32 protein [Anaerolineaceae bacterium]
MGAIPEFLLRKLFVANSLKPEADGFQFELLNTFTPVALLNLGLAVDDIDCPVAKITLLLPGQPPCSATDITPTHPFVLPMNIVVAVQVQCAEPLKRLTIRAETREAGLLQFSIPLKAGDRGPKSHPNFCDTLRRQLRQVRQSARVRRDPLRPGWHFAPRLNWLNDPNGLIYWQDHYHLFYQHNPLEPTWGNIHWGHAISNDLLHWTHLPIALAPDPAGADAGGCFSGCAVAHHGAVNLLYTGVYPEVQCLATSSDIDLRRWQKHPEPIISAPPEGLSGTGFRDPCVWREGAEWRLALGSGIAGVGGAVLLYRSRDLLVWDYLGILYQGDAQIHEPVWTGTMWECPAFFPLGDRWVLIISASAVEGGLHTLYYTGDYRENRFFPDHPPRLLDYGAGGCYYAPQTFLDSQNRRVIIGWLRESRSAAEQSQAGWSGALSLPWVLMLDPTGELRCRPWEAVVSLRKTRETLTGRPGTSRIQGASLELLIRVDETAPVWSGAILLADAQVQARIGYDPTQKAVTLDCQPGGGLLSTIPVPPAEAAAGSLTLRVFIDGSIIEIFPGNSLPASARFYPQNPRALQVQCVGGAQVDVWQLQP